MGEDGKQYLVDRVTSIAAIEEQSGVQFIPDGIDIDRLEPQTYWTKQSTCSE